MARPAEVQLEELIEIGKRVMKTHNIPAPTFKPTNITEFPRTIRGEKVSCACAVAIIERKGHRPLALLVTDHEEAFEVTVGDVTYEPDDTVSITTDGQLWGNVDLFEETLEVGISEHNKGLGQHG